MRKRWLMASVSGLMLAVCATAQTPAAKPAEVIANGGLLRTLEAAPVTAEPYSAIQVQRVVRTLPDGTTIKNGPGPGHAVMRDSQGRVRVERRLTKANGNDPGTFMVFVLDPVGHSLTTWSTGGTGEKVALVIKLPAEKPQLKPAGTQQPAEPAGRPQPIVTTENLGSEILEGVTVDVTKTTTIVPIGRAGNDAPITRTHEVWTAPDLKLALKEQWNDPRTGEQTVWLKDVSRAEPNAALFRAPAGYKVKDLKQTMQELAQKLSAMPD